MKPQTPNTRSLDEALNSLLCEDIASVAARPIPPSSLLDRVRQSAAVRSTLSTVRARQDTWSRVTAGVRKKVLRNGSQGASVLLELQPGVSLPVHRHAWLEEAICLAGGLRTGDLDLGPGDYQVSQPGSRHGQITSCPRRGALAYLRGTSLGNPGRQIAELLGGWLPGQGAPQHTVLLRDGGWQPIGQGVEVLPLWQGDGLASRYVRLSPGATLPAHDHGMDEECMMIEGDAFFGDLLIQAGDFHLAPAGTRHGEVCSDGGALFFLRGAAEAS
jgi:anti-sigma factor ChrR (cupin superfamily)